MGFLACGCKGATVNHIDEQNQSTIDMLNKKPELRQYKEDAQAVKNAESLWGSQVFGGNVFSPIGKTKLTQRNVQNPLLDELKKQPISVLYGGGFYVLKNVKYAANVYADIWILIEAIDDPKAIQKFHQYNNIPREERKSKVGLKFDNIKQHLNGYGRIIYFKTNDESFRAERCTLIKMHEGRFKQSEPDGYCRIFNCPLEGSCELGYFKEKEPQGKYQKFETRGQCIESGIKEGNHLVKSCEINSYQTRLIKTANDSIGHTPAMRGQRNSQYVNNDDRYGGLEQTQAPRQYNAPVDRSNPYGYDVNDQYTYEQVDRRNSQYEQVERRNSQYDQVERRSSPDRRNSTYEQVERRNTVERRNSPGFNDGVVSDNSRIGIASGQKRRMSNIKV